MGAFLGEISTSGSIIFDRCIICMAGFNYSSFRFAFYFSFFTILLDLLSFIGRYDFICYWNCSLWSGGCRLRKFFWLCGLFNKSFRLDWIDGGGIDWDTFDLFLSLAHWLNRLFVEFIHGRFMVFFGISDLSCCCLRILIRSIKIDVYLNLLFHSY